MTTFNLEITEIDGITYYTTVTGKHSTMMFVMHDHTYVMVNKSPARPLKDIVKQSKAVKNLLSVMEA